MEHDELISKVRLLMSEVSSEEELPKNIVAMIANVIDEFNQKYPLRKTDYFLSLAINADAGSNFKFIGYSINAPKGFIFGMLEALLERLDSEYDFKVLEGLVNSRLAKLGDSN